MLEHSRELYFTLDLIAFLATISLHLVKTNRNLILNEGARADTIPFLEIETAEVKCSHAGAVGRVDDEHLFYLQSRGVPKEAAKRLIVFGFFQEVLEQITFAELRDELVAAVERKVA